MKILLIISVPLLFLLSCSDVEEKNKRPNILWIVADDLGTDLRCYGEEDVYTPNLDKLASEGNVYTNFFTVTAVCSPSRSALITGMYPVSINSHQHRTRYKKPLPSGIDPVTYHFRKAGYFTFNGDFTDPSKPGKQDYNFLADSIYDGTHWSQCPDGMPFFGQIQIFYPHRPFKEDPSNPVNQDQLDIPPYYPDHPITRKDWAQYLEFVQLLDKEVGKVMSEAEKDGLLENTIIFFFGDQGRPHVREKQFLYDGGINTPLIIRFPDHKMRGMTSDRMVSNIDISAASLRLAGIEIPEYLHGRDFIGVDSPPREYIYAMRDRRDETVDRIRAVRSKQFKYIRNFYPDKPYTQFNAYKKFRYPVLTLMEVLKEQGRLTEAQKAFMKPDRPAEELYDMYNDPFEIVNLAESPIYQDTLIKFRALLDNWLLKYDVGKYPEDSAEIQHAQQLMKEHYKEWMESIDLDENATDEELLKYWYEYLGIEQ